MFPEPTFFWSLTTAAASSILLPQTDVNAKHPKKTHRQWLLNCSTPMGSLPVLSSFYKERQHNSATWREVSPSFYQKVLLYFRAFLDITPELSSLQPECLIFPWWCHSLQTSFRSWLDFPQFSVKNPRIALHEAYWGEKKSLMPLNLLTGLAESYLAQLLGDPTHRWSWTRFPLRQLALTESKLGAFSQR